MVRDINIWIYLQNVNIWVCLLLFSVYFIFDVFYCHYIIATTKLEAGKAACLSMLIGGIPYIGMQTFIDNPWYALPPIVGYGVGTFSIIKLEKWRRKNNEKKDIQDIG